MRPIRIELEGFSAYRTREIVDLASLSQSDIAFFSLTGATGAGKSSLVDAMIFALYGRIPRLGARAVAPVISAGVDRARVQLDFEVGGEVHTAVRLVQRTASGGASVKEARLQLGERVIADGADNVTKAVEELLRLGFDDFTRTVVLPQGEFARFLNATAAERQNLLRELLGLEVYGRVRQLATGRHSVADALVESARHRLERIESPTKEEIDALRARLASLEGMESVIAEAEYGLAALEKEHDGAELEFARLQGSVERLEALVPPDRLEELAGLVAEARAQVADAEDALAEISAEAEALDEERAGLPEPETLAMTRARYQTLEQTEARISGVDLESARAARGRADDELARARGAQAEARSRLDSTVLSHAAHSIAATLTPGDTCPVCRQRVTDVPEAGSPEELAAAESGMRQADTRVSNAEAIARTIQTQVTELETTHGELASARDRLLSELAGAPTLDRLSEIEEKCADLKARLARARARSEDAADRLEKARRADEDLAADQRQMSRALRSVQQTVADLSPPISESDDVVVEWKELLAWRDETLVRVSEERSAAAARQGSIEAKVVATRTGILDRLARVGIEASGSFQAAVAAETERARHALNRVEENVAEIETLREEIETEARRAEVAKSLADHLRAGGFEKWMMAGALEALVAGANGLLAELSDRGYSLHSADGAFTVIDHRNADERRPVSTLSGGETFLVSLALALSLAETHASHGDARLDTVILDEGFGALDDETLDTAASVLEELARNRGLMVGVITHVKELAERATVRFEVVRGPQGSTVRELA
jgi:DNA repair protein SbcC/Rad50